MAGLTSHGSHEGAAPAAPSAVYVLDEDEGRITHAVEHGAGGFLVSSTEVGKAIVAFLNSATATDIAMLHAHLLYAFADAHASLAALPEEDEAA
jgi:hypothetical protein